MVARRDVPGKEGKQFGVPMEPAAFVAHVQGLLEEVQGALLAQARAFRDANIVDVSSYEEMQAAVAEGAWAAWVLWGGGGVDTGCPAVLLQGACDACIMHDAAQAHARLSAARPALNGPAPSHALPPAGKWARGPWAGSDDDERRVKEETSATLRCFPFEQPAHGGKCFMTGAPATEVAIFAKAY